MPADGAVQREGGRGESESSRRPAGNPAMTSEAIIPISPLSLRNAITDKAVQINAKLHGILGGSPWPSSAASIPASTSPMPPLAMPGLPVGLMKTLAVRRGDHGARAL